MNLMSIRTYQFNGKTIAELTINLGGGDAIDQRVIAMIDQLEENVREVMLNRGYDPNTCQVSAEYSNDINEPNGGRVCCSITGQGQIHIDIAKHALQEAVRML